MTWRHILPLTLLAAVGAAHSLYYFAPTLDDRPWWAYVGVHALALVSLLMLLPQAARWPLSPIGPVACWWGAIESAQAMGCAWLMWGSASSEDLCVQRFGYRFYIVGLSLAGAWLIVQRWWRPRHG